ncbi:hypothetical protein [Pseudomonas fluorescens group sp. PF-69]
MNEKHAAALGALVRIVSLMLSSPSPDIGLGRRMNLLLPMGFCSSECPEVNEGGIEAGSLAPVGEFLRVDCHLIDELATRSALLVFLRSAFEPLVIGFGKFRVVADERGEGIIFIR